MQPGKTMKNPSQSRVLMVLGTCSIARNRGKSTTMGSQANTQARLRPMCLMRLTLAML